VDGTLESLEETSFLFRLSSSLSRSLLALLDPLVVEFEHG
jgi:hypothetical protein